MLCGSWRANGRGSYIEESQVQPSLGSLSVVLFFFWPKAKVIVAWSEWPGKL